MATYESSLDKVVLQLRMANEGDPYAVLDDTGNFSPVLLGNAFISPDTRSPHGHSLYIPGEIKDGLKVPITVAGGPLNLAADDFTISMYVRLHSLYKEYQYFFSLSSGRYYSWPNLSIGAYSGTIMEVAVRSVAAAASGSAPDILYYGGISTVSANVRNHFELSRQGSLFKFRLNGHVMRTFSSTLPIGDTPNLAGLGIGAGTYSSNGIAEENSHAYYDNLCIIKGAAVDMYGVQLIPRRTVSGVVLDSEQRPIIGREVRMYRRSNGLMIGSPAITQAPDGRYSIGTAYTGEVQVVCLGSDTPIVENDSILRTFPV